MVACFAALHGIEILAVEFQLSTLCPANSDHLFFFGFHYSALWDARSYVVLVHHRSIYAPH